MSQQMPPDPARDPIGRIPWSSAPADQRELQRICRDLDELAVELTRTSARTRISIHAVRLAGVSEDAVRLERLQVQGFFGLERNVPHAPIAFLLPATGSGPPGPLHTLDGRPLAAASPILEQFCTRPFPEIRVRESGSSILKIVELPPEAQGHCDVVVGHRDHVRLHREAWQGAIEFSSCVRVPSRLLHIHAYTHRSIQIGESSTTRMYRAGLSGAPIDRSFDQIAEFPGPTRSRAGAPVQGGDAARVLGIAAAMFESAGWPVHEFEHHHVSVPMPVWGAEYAVGLSLRPPTASP